MTNHTQPRLCCSFIPAYVFKTIADADQVDAHTREIATQAFELSGDIERATQVCSIA